MLVKKWIVLLLAVFSQPVWAAWVAVGGSDRLDHYVDPLTLRGTSNGRRMWVLVNSKSPRMLEGGGRFLSMKALVEFDCSGERSRSLQISFHSGLDGSGTMIDSTSSPGQWEFVSPGTAEVTYLETACKLPLRKP